MSSARSIRLRRWRNNKEPERHHLTRDGCFGILGPNGAGKTTTVECLQGLRKADGGDLAVLGHDPRHEAAQLRLIGSQQPPEGDSGGLAPG